MLILNKYKFSKFNYLFIFTFLCFWQFSSAQCVNPAALPGDTFVANFFRPTCFGASDGLIDITGITGVNLNPSYSVRLLTGIGGTATTVFTGITGSSFNITGLAAGTYYLDIQDQCGNTSSDRQVIIPDDPNVTLGNSAGTPPFIRDIIVNPDCTNIVYQVDFSIASACNGSTYTGTITNNIGTTSNFQFTTGRDRNNGFNLCSRTHTGMFYSGTNDIYNIPAAFFNGGPINIQITSPCGDVRTSTVNAPLAFNIGIIGTHSPTNIGCLKAYNINRTRNSSISVNNISATIVETDPTFTIITNTNPLNASGNPFTPFNGPMNFRNTGAGGNLVFSQMLYNVYYKITYTDACGNTTTENIYKAIPVDNFNVTYGGCGNPASNQFDNIGLIIPISYPTGVTLYPPIKVSIINGPAQWQPTPNGPVAPVFNINYPIIYNNYDPNVVRTYLPGGTYDILWEDSCGNQKLVTATIGNSCLSEIATSYTFDSCSSISGTTNLTYRNPGRIGFAPRFAEQFFSIYNSAGTLLQTVNAASSGGIPTFTNLTPGTYRIRFGANTFLSHMTPVGGYFPGNNIFEEVVVVPNITPLSFVLSGSTCGSTLSISGVGGQAPYVYNMYTNSGGTLLSGPNATGVFTGLIPGNFYYLEVRDACGRTFGDTLEIYPIQPPPTIGLITQGTCYSLGSVELNDLPSGNWIITQTPGGNTYTGNSSSFIVTSLSEGSYSFNVTNLNGCTSVPTSPNIIINPIPVCPIALDDQGSYLIGNPISINILSNDSSDSALNPISVNIVGGTDTNGDGFNDTLVVPGEGTWVVDTATGTVTFTPIVGFVGLPTPISYSVQDIDGDTSNIAIVTLSTIVSSNTTICSGDALTYQLEITVTIGTAPFTVIGTGTPGTWVGNVWISSPLPKGTNYNVTVTDSNLPINNSIVISGLDPDCCVFAVTCPVLPSTIFPCYGNLPNATNLTETEFEALGNGDGIIGDYPCGVVEITALNTADSVCEGNVTRTFTVTEYADPNNNDIRDLGENTVLNTQTCTQTFIIERADFTMPANASSTVACPSDVVAPTVPTVTDACGNTLTPSAPVVSASPTCEGNVTYTYTFTDCEGNTHNWVYTYIIERNDFSMPTNAASTVACPADLVVPTVPIVIDACGTTLTPSAPLVSVSPTCEGNVTYTYTFTDCEGNTHNWVYTYIIERADFTMPANASSTVACPADVVAPIVPTVIDACGNTLIPSAPVVSALPSCEGNVAYTYTFTDCGGNTHDWVYTYTIERADFTMPVNASSTVACPADAVAPTVPTVTDACGNTLIPSVPVVSALPSCEGNVTYTYTFTDCEGNTHDWVYTYTVERNDFTMPANASSTVACPADVVAPTVPIVTDACGNTLTPSAPVVSATPTCEGVVTYTYTFTDCEGNTHDWVYTYTIERADFTMPVNASSTVACPADVVTPTVPTVTDACGNTLIPSVPVVSALPSCEGNVSYTYTFTDCEGNTHDWVYTYTVERNDFTMPVNASSTVACPADVVTPTVPTVTDACGNTLTPSSPVVSTSPTCEGNVTYTYTYTDCEGNIHDWVYTYTIERADFTMPANASSTVACPADVVAPTVPTVIDACGTTLTPSAPVVSASPACEGTVTYTYSFTDCGGNTHDWVYTYTIERADFTMPVNASSTVACLADAVAPTVPTVIDACGNTLIPSAPVVSATPTCEGNVTYTYTFADCGGNTHDWVYTYTIDDTISPTGTAPANLTLQCIANIPAADINSVVDEADNCVGTVAVTVLDTNNGGTGCLGNPYIVTRTYTLTDCAGNSSDLIQTITVEDDTNPTFVETLPSNLVLECGDSIPAAVTLTAIDNCSTATVVYNEQRTNGLCLSNYTLTRTWLATDVCGNEITHIQTIDVKDSTPPVFIGELPVDVFVDCDSIPVAPIVTASDTCGNTTVTLSETEVEGDCSNRYQLIRTWTATDDCGNSSIHTQTISLACHIKIWNAVSPNGDAKNDVFYLEGIDCYPNNSVEVYNRWGVKVFETSGYDNINKVFKGYSDGRSTISKNELLPTGTYFYILKYEYNLYGNNQQNIEKSGYLYIQNN